VLKLQKSAKPAAAVIDAMLLESRETGAANKRSERKERAKEKGLRYGGGGSLVEVRIGI
jgi:hypothetical protein